jgi:hypothetical protein
MPGSTIILTPVSVPLSVPLTGHLPQITAHDLQTRLMSYLGSNPEGASHADCNRAILDAYREMPGLHTWTYLLQVARLFRNAPYDTGTVEYDHTGGTYERQMTLTDGVWPTWAARGYIRLGTVISYVDQRISDTVITLDATYNPGADVAALTEYEIVQDSYQLPIDFTVGDRGLPENNWGEMQYCRPADWLALQRCSQSSGDTRTYTFMADPKAAGRLCFRIFPAPDTAETIDFIYRRKCRDINTWEQTTGRASVSAGQNLINLSDGGTFKNQHVGAVIRLSATANSLPTAPEGLNPCAIERTILQLVSSTQAQVDDTVSDTYASVAYRISDPIDIEPTAMYNALYAACIRHLCFARNRKELADATTNWRFMLDLAKEADMRDNAADSASLGVRWRQRLANMPLGPNI